MALLALERSANRAEHAQVGRVTMNDQLFTNLQFAKGSRFKLIQGSGGNAREFIHIRQVLADVNRRGPVLEETH